MDHFVRACLVVCLLSVAFSPASAQTASVRGTVADASDGLPLGGANVALVRPGGLSLTAGTATDAYGLFELAAVEPGTYDLVVRFIGYRELRETVRLAPDEERQIDAVLIPGVDLNPVTVSASRGQTAEKVLDAPASISVLEARQVEQSSSLNSIDALRMTPGVDFASTGIDRQEVVLRGFNNAFSASALVLTDYRRGSVASLGVNGYDFMPIASIDIERVEVVRGPSSALYGAGGDGGVIHFFTKNPFQYPGTTVSVAGGERSAFIGALRHAGVVNNRLGYKFTGQYARAEDWHLDPADPHDAGQLQGDVRARDYDYQKGNLNGMLQYRFTDRTSLIANAGYNTSHNTYLSGIGTLQSVGFGYTFGQLRFISGPLFAQAYINRNDAGDSFVYGTGMTVVDNSDVIGIQGQYNLDLMDGRQRFVVGSDYERTRPDTEGTILGRNEGEVFHEVGAYVQSTTALTEEIDVAIALRGDYNNVVTGLQISPRAALVYKVSPLHSLRATFNRAFARPGTNSVFLDIEAARVGPLTIRARGSVEGYSFQRNPAFEPLAGTDLIASSLNPANFGHPQPVGLPLDAVYAQVYAGLNALLLSDQPLPPPLSGLNQQQRQQLAAMLDPSVTPVGGFTKGSLGMLNQTTMEIEPVQGVRDIEPLRQPTTQTLELGYKGLINDRLLLSVDLYHTRRENFVGPLMIETPFVLVPSLGEDLQGAMAVAFGTNQQLSGALQQFGLTPEQAAGIIAGFAAGDLPDASTPVAVVQPAENSVPGELLMTYRNFGKVSLYGLDLAAFAGATDRLNVHGSFSYVSRNFFSAEEAGEPGTELEVSLNSPQFKLAAGFEYTVPRGISVRPAVRYVDGFIVRSGPYSGEIPGYFIMDLGAGYDLGDFVNGMRIDIISQNLLDNSHRQFIGAPKIGRFTLVRLTYAL